MPADSVATYVDERFDDFLADLESVVAQPSVSATGEGIPECADLAEALCRDYGFDETRTVETDGHSAVIAHAYADHDPNRQVATLLVYGHYDVQPVTPGEWTTPPFEPTTRDGPDGRRRLYGRGTGDNKGQWFAHLCAIRALRETTGLPVNVTLVLDGEEESGSEHLGTVVAENADALDGELVYIADGPVDDSGRPHVLMGARGLLYVKIDVSGADRDLHSGNYGGPVPNPAWALVGLLASMRTANGRVAVDGFYENVRPMADVDHEVLDAIPFDADALRRELGVRGFSVGPDETYLEKILYRPTLNVSGLTSGYGGDGTKTIIPSTASAKLGMRLVPDQRPNAVWRRVRDHVRSHAPETVDVTVRRLESMTPQRTSLDSPFTDPIVRAVRDAWEQDPVLKSSLGGSLPAYVFTEELGLPCIIVPYGNSDQNNHSPDENFTLENFEKGIYTTVRVLSELARE